MDSKLGRRKGVPYITVGFDLLHLLHLPRDAKTEQKQGGHSRTQAVLKWVAHHAAITEPDKLPLCLDCDETFAATRRPHLFAVMVDPGKGLWNVSGICRTCAERADHGEGLQPMAVRRMRTILPRLQVLPVLGHG